jgi:hypothetical protein
MGGRPWTKGELDRLRVLAGKQPTAQIAQNLDRKIAAIVQKAFELRLSLKLSLQDEVKPPSVDRGSDVTES